MTVVLYTGFCVVITKAETQHIKIELSDTKYKQQNIIGALELCILVVYIVILFLKKTPN